MRTVRDFKNGLFSAGNVLKFGGFITATQVVIGSGVNESVIISGATTIVLSIPAFFVNYTPIKIKNDIISVPAVDQVRTFWDILFINPIVGHFRRRKYNVADIEQATPQYTYANRDQKDRDWSIVITGMKNNKSFSQKVQLSNQQSRTEALNAIRQTIKGRTQSEFSY